jgi:hypothetical protein
MNDIIKRDVSIKLHGVTYSHHPTNLRFNSNYDTSAHLDALNGAQNETQCSSAVVNKVWTADREAWPKGAREITFTFLF